MRLSFSKIYNSFILDTRLEEEKTRASLNGKIFKKNGLYCFEGDLSLSLELPCDVCCCEFLQEFRQELVLWFSDGMYTPKSQDLSIDAIEFFDGYIDFDYVMRSEASSLRSDYHKCDNCKNTKG